MRIADLVAEVLNSRLLTRQRQAQLEQLIEAGLCQEQELEAIDRLLIALTSRQVVAGDCICGHCESGSAASPRDPSDHAFFEGAFSPGQDPVGLGEI